MPFHIWYIYKCASAPKWHPKKLCVRLRTSVHTGYIFDKIIEKIFSLKGQKSSELYYSGCWWLIDIPSRQSSLVNHRQLNDKLSLLPKWRNQEFVSFNHEACCNFATMAPKGLTLYLLLSVSCPTLLLCVLQRGKPEPHPVWCCLSRVGHKYNMQKYGGICQLRFFV